jgi:hypothetical protein
MASLCVIIANRKITKNKPMQNQTVITMLCDGDLATKNPVVKELRKETKIEYLEEISKKPNNKFNK